MLAAQINLTRAKPEESAMSNFYRRPQLAGKATYKYAATQR